MRSTRVENEPILLAPADSPEADPRVDLRDTAGEAPEVRRWLGGLRRWWRAQLTTWVEDEAIGPGDSKGRPIRLVLPLVLPVLGVAALVVVREPGNIVAAICLAFGAVAIAYGAMADALER